MRIELGISGTLVWCSAYWANLPITCYRIFKLFYFMRHFDFLDIDDFARMNSAWLDKDLKVSDLQAMPRKLRNMTVNIRKPKFYSHWR